MRRLGHPSMRKLQRWVQGENLPLQRHLSTCDYCADRLEPLLDASANENIKAALVELLEMPETVPDRIRTGIDARLENQRDLTLIGELFSVPLQTARLMTAPEQGND